MYLTLQTGLFAKPFVNKLRIANVHKLRTFMQYFFQDMHGFPVGNSMSLSTKTNLWAIAFKFAVAIPFQVNNFG